MTEQTMVGRAMRVAEDAVRRGDWTNETAVSWVSQSDTMTEESMVWWEQMNTRRNQV